MLGSLAVLLLWPFFEPPKPSEATDHPFFAFFCPIAYFYSLHILVLFIPTADPNNNTHCPCLGTSCIVHGPFASLRCRRGAYTCVDRARAVRACVLSCFRASACVGVPSGARVCACVVVVVHPRIVMCARMRCSCSCRQDLRFAHKSLHSRPHPGHPLSTSRNRTSTLSLFEILHPHRCFGRGPSNHHLTQPHDEDPDRENIQETSSSRCVGKMFHVPEHMVCI